MLKKLFALGIATIMALGTTMSAFAAEPTEEVLEFVQIQKSGKRFESINDYGFDLAKNERSAQLTNEYEYLFDILKNEDKIYESADGKSYCFDLSVVDLLDIQNLEKVVEISNIEGLYYSIAYYTTDGEFVTIQYLKDGTKNCYVRNSDEGETVTGYNGKKETVTDLSWNNNSITTSTRSTKRIDYPKPSQCGFKDTGSKGKVIKTKDVYINALGKNESARVVEFESNYKKVGSGWLPFAANTAIGAINTKLGWGESAIANFLGAAGVAIAVIDGVKKIKEEISLPQYSDYTAMDGKYGDIYDETVYKKYCRVVFNTGTSKYIGGMNPDGSFGYVKKGYTGIKTDTEILNKVQSLYNSCLVTHNGSNECYNPV